MDRAFVHREARAVRERHVARWERQPDQMTHVGYGVRSVVASLEPLGNRHQGTVDELGVPNNL